MNSPLIDSCIKYLLKHPKRVIAAIALLSMLAGTMISQLQLDASAESLMLEHDSDLQYYRDIYARTGANDSYLVVAYTPRADLFSKRELQRLRSLRDALQDVPGVAKVTSILDAPLIFQPGYSLPRLAAHLPTLDQPGTRVEAARREFLSSPLYREMLLSEDGRTTALRVDLETDPILARRQSSIDWLRSQPELDQAGQEALQSLQEEFEQRSAAAEELRDVAIARIRANLQDYREHAEVHLGGLPMIVVDMIQFIQQDFLFFGLGIVAFLMVMLGLIFRSPRWVLIPMAVCAATAVIMTGLLSVMGWKITVISSNYISLLLIISMSIVVHFAVRYRELCAESPSDKQPALVLKTIAMLARPCLFMVLTTVVAFTSLMLSGIRPVIDFGRIMSLGVVLAYLVSFSLCPALLLLLPRERVNGDTRFGTWFTGHMAGLVTNRRTLLLAASTAMLAFALTGISRLDVENRFIDYFKSDTEIHQGMKTIDQRLGGTATLDLIVSTDHQGNPEADYSPQEYREAHRTIFNEEPDRAPDSYWLSPTGMAEVDRIHRYLESRPEIGKVMSLATAYRMLKTLNLEQPINSYQIGMIYNFLPRSVSDQLIASYLLEDRNQVRISMRLHDTSPSLQRDQLIREVRSHLVNELGYRADQIRFTGVALLYNNMLQSLYESQIQTLGFVFIAIYCMMAMLFRSPVLALIGTAPNILVALLVLGMMGWAGIPLDIMTITIAAIVLGIGVDDTIHYLHRFGREFARDQDYGAAMRRSHDSIGRAMTYTSVAVISGFSILLLSQFIPSIYFGALTGLAMLLALLAALTLLPALIVTVRPYSNRAIPGADILPRSDRARPAHRAQPFRAAEPDT